MIKICLWLNSSGASIQNQISHFWTDTNYPGKKITANLSQTVTTQLYAMINFENSKMMVS